MLTWPIKHMLLTLLKLLKQSTQQEVEEGLVSQEETQTGRLLLVDQEAEKFLQDPESYLWMRML